MRNVTRLLVAGALLAACGGGGGGDSVDVTEPPPPPEPTHGSVTAVVDGVTWNLHVWNAPVRVGPTFGFTAQNAISAVPEHLQLNIDLFDFDLSGATPVSLVPPNRAALYVNAKTWLTSLAGGSGTLTFTSLTATGASGTFSFIAMPDVNTGATGTKQVANGTFTLIF